jgi:hypothetical protein
VYRGLRELSICTDQHAVEEPSQVKVLPVTEEKTSLPVYSPSKAVLCFLSDIGSNSFLSRQKQCYGEHGRRQKGNKDQQASNSGYLSSLC